MPAVAPRPTKAARPAPRPAAAGPETCAVCKSPDIGFVLETVLGTDAQTLQPADPVRVPFCSLACLKTRLSDNRPDKSEPRPEPSGAVDSEP